ncbi:hypothetical protein QN345_02230 [Cryobacterium sp. 10I1]|uniref:hypothetical protein n=1 Tax=unclassified Cryobacterium TaxID=2649013 RepID=UPI002B224CE9|nr:MULTISPECIES: hypothetical protein [unclassified Cryobacterium]MEB0286855.1 hypothetical protein [Cryobacterium sp. 10S3]MEB0304153.1 hypothetical protein [Cryobacterium sp. 10I1]
MAEAELPSSRLASLVEGTIAESADEKSRPVSILGAVPVVRVSHEKEERKIAGVPEGLSYFLIVHPMTTFFGVLAEKEFGHLKAPSFHSKREKSKGLYWTCVVFDFVWMTTAILLIFTVLSRIVWKSFFS